MLLVSCHYAPFLALSVLFPLELELLSFHTMWTPLPSSPPSSSSLSVALTSSSDLYSVNQPNLNDLSLPGANTPKAFYQTTLQGWTFVLWPLLVLPSSRIYTTGEELVPQPKLRRISLLDLGSGDRVRKLRGWRDIWSRNPLSRFLGICRNQLRCKAGTYLYIVKRKVVYGFTCLWTRIGFSLIQWTDCLSFIDVRPHKHGPVFQSDSSVRSAQLFIL